MFNLTLTEIIIFIIIPSLVGVLAPYLYKKVPGGKNSKK